MILEAGIHIRRHFFFTFFVADFMKTLLSPFFHFFDGGMKNLLFSINMTMKHALVVFFFFFFFSPTSASPKQISVCQNETFKAQCLVFPPKALRPSWSTTAITQAFEHAVVNLKRRPSAIFAMCTTEKKNFKK